MAAELRSLTLRVETDRWEATVLRDIALCVPAGQITALLGGPGAGKTMIARTLAGRLPKSARVTGEVDLDGTVGYVPQDGVDAFAPDSTVATQLGQLARNGGWSVEEACAAAHYPLEAADLLPNENSAGQIQRAAFAAALLLGPDVLIADGPTASLDRFAAYEVWKSLRAVADAGAALLIVTNDVPLLGATGFADRLAVIERGRILAAGPTAEVVRSEDPRVGMYFGRGR